MTPASDTPAVVASSPVAPVRSAGRAPAKLTVRKVSRWYGDVIALNAVDLAFGPGVTGLLGPNGAGKTTLIRLLVGMATPGDGTVELDGQRIRGNLAALVRIGFVPDGDGLYEDVPARRFLLDQAEQRGFTGAAREARVDEVVRRVGLEEYVPKKMGALSKGNRQKCKLAQALLHDPDVLVLDEPLTGLDPIMRRDFIAVVRSLGDEGVTVVVSSHVLHEVEAMTDDIVLMRHGQVLAEGKVADIRDTLDTHARRIRIGTPDPRALGRLLLGEDDLVSGLAFEGADLVAATMHRDRLCAFVQQAAVDGAAEVTALEPLDDDLRSVFSYLVT
ncbi:MAG: ABC transporter ATP-binding protein [Planctomycetes bacterium]|nr:ABC transporter ATP-binding protein [Planctomycetota bacterium]